MCELFGVSSGAKIRVNGLLNEFFSHSVRHRNGWGMAVFHDAGVSLEKEPVQASESAYLRERLRQPVSVRSMMAHIRLATVGTMEYKNCHPFVMRDGCGRRWTLAHNGTIFDASVLEAYVHTQEGETDSERILCGLIETVCKRQRVLGRDLSAEERFELVDGFVGQIAPGNKLNLLIYDGDLMYVHTNYAHSLYVRTKGETALFATVPLDGGQWDEVPFTAVCAYRAGRMAYIGKAHGHEYRDCEHDMRTLFMAYAQL